MITAPNIRETHKSAVMNGAMADRGKSRTIVASMVHLRRVGQAEEVFIMSSRGRGVALSAIVKRAD